MVTPAGKESDEPKAVKPGLYEVSLESNRGTQASITGNRFAWTSEYVFPESKAPGVDYLSTRGPDGWSSENVVPPQSVENGAGCPLVIGIAAYSSDLSKGVLADGYGQPGSFKGENLSCGHDEPLLATQELQGFQNLFLRDNDPLSYQLIDVTPSNAPVPETTPENNGQYYPASFLAGSKELDHIVFEEELPLTTNAGAGDELYEWTGGADYLITVLPGGTVAHGTLAGSTRNTSLEESTQTFLPFNIANFNHAMSSDGLRVFFEAEGNLYVRENAEQSLTEECSGLKACTEQIDVAQGGSGASGGGKFRIASEDGSKVFFTDDSRLTTDSNAEVGKSDLYEYDFEKPLGQRLSDLTADADEAADVLGVSGASGDGSYIYFVAEGQLTNTQNSENAIAVPDEPNLYQSHDGVTTFIATLDANNDSCDWMSPACIDAPFLGGLSARVSQNGAFIGFDSDLKLTGYDNVGDACVPQGTAEQVTSYAPGSCSEIFLYDVKTNTLSCASCDPSGAPPLGPAVIRFPGPPSTAREMRNAYPQRNVSDAGQVFFETKDSLVPSANNGKLNVYEYQDGQPHLISRGTGEADSYFLDASTDGSDVFFATAEQLLREDAGSVYDVYDARVNGGFLESPNAPAACTDETGCRASDPAVPVFSAPSSATFVATETSTDTGNTHKTTKKATKKKSKKKPKKKKKKGKAAKKARKDGEARHSKRASRIQKGGK